MNISISPFHPQGLECSSKLMMGLKCSNGTSERSNKRISDLNEMKSKSIKYLYHCRNNQRYIFLFLLDHFISKVLKDLLKLEIDQLRVNQILVFVLELIH